MKILKLSEYIAETKKEKNVETPVVEAIGMDLSKVKSGSKYLVTPKGSQDPMKIVCTDISKDDKGMWNVDWTNLDTDEKNSWYFTDEEYSFAEMNESTTQDEATNEDVNTEVKQFINTMCESLGITPFEVTNLITKTLTDLNINESTEVFVIEDISVIDENIYEAIIDKAAKLAKYKADIEKTKEAEEDNDEKIRLKGSSKSTQSKGNMLTAKIKWLQDKISELEKQK